MSIYVNLYGMSVNYIYFLSFKFVTDVHIKSKLFKEIHCKIGV